MQRVPLEAARAASQASPVLLQPLQIGQVDRGISMLAMLASICAAVLSSL